MVSSIGTGPVASSKGYQAVIVNPMEILSSLRRALGEDAVDVTPPHMKTARGWSEAWGMSRQRTGELLREAVDCGRFEVKQYRVKSGARVLKVPHYGPAQHLRKKP